ncbi:Alpha/Beta hydrolase protein [Penicillium argentinense]|uniref:Alpha/Beta hydrolase protein n=1 Tax=Penicillium argentinense TaxID=1131581 RepID=A0A9W9KM55_9EURO|nr:Alpha/Beta hydrolase protein [Penicillium argentinense]KAJ5111285.1 Alpha/Beta hydrolase protein [Penicillium argentinense]
MSKSDRFDQLPETTPKSSELKINIAGFHTYIYGADELSPQQAKNTVVLFHVHGRTRTYKNAELFAHQFLHQMRQHGESKKGFVVVTFDNRNHGERAVFTPPTPTPYRPSCRQPQITNKRLQIDKKSIQSWKGGNEKHAHDMLAMIDGIALDIQTVMRFLGVYVEDRFTPIEFVMSGHSLGGHTSWNILAQEPKIKAAIISVGCPNMTDLLQDRLGGKDVVDPVRWPDSISSMFRKRDEDVSKITDKQVLILNGALDTLVPSKFTKPWVENYGQQNDVSLNVFEETGHWFSLEMMDKVVDWVLQKIA